MDISQLNEMSDIIMMCNRRANEVLDKLELANYTLADHRAMGELHRIVTGITESCTEFQINANHLKRKLEMRRS
jgi:hypothetical protein